MDIARQHRQGVLTLYRTVLRHLRHLPKPLDKEVLSLVTTEFRTYKHLKGKSLQSKLLECYDYEKQLFKFHHAEESVGAIEEAVTRYKDSIGSRKLIKRLKKKPSIVESYPRADPQTIDKLQMDQRLHVLISKLIKSDQSRSMIPHKSELDSNYINQIYGIRVIHMKASQYFRKIWRIFGPDSKPYELKYVYNNNTLLPMLALRTPIGTVREFDEEIFKLGSKFMQYFKDLKDFEERQVKDVQWLQMEDDWERMIGDEMGTTGTFARLHRIPGNKYFSDPMLPDIIKFHNRKVMFMKSKLQPFFDEYHEVQRGNFDKMTEVILQTSINEFNEYSTSLSKIMKDFEFHNKKLVFDFDQFEAKLDPKEFDWKV